MGVRGVGQGAAVRPEKKLEGREVYETECNIESHHEYLLPFTCWIAFEWSGKTLKPLEVRRFESLVGGLRGMGIRAADAENLKKQGIGTKMEEKSKPAPSSESQGAAPGR